MKNKFFSLLSTTCNLLVEIVFLLGTILVFVIIYAILSGIKNVDLTSVLVGAGGALMYILMIEFITNKKKITDINIDEFVKNKSN